MTDSPTLTELTRAAAEKPDAVAEFWARMAAEGTPLIEPDPTDPDARLVTFLWRDDPAAPANDVLAILHTITDRDRHAGDLTPHLMRRIPGTDIWALGRRLPADLRASYQFFVGTGPRADTVRTDRPGWLRVLDTAVPDPLSRTPELASRDGRNPSSVLELPAAPAQPWVRRRPDAPRGGRVDTTVDGRRVSVLTPVEPPGETPYRVAVVLDGDMWGSVLDLDATLDNLHADGLIPPTVTLLVDTMGRDRRMTDLSCSEEFVDWIADVLLPWAGERHGVSADPAHTVIAGQSAGGLTAAFAGYARPDRFGNALSQSGSFWWPDPDEGNDGPEWLTRRFAAGERRSIRLYVEVGLLEWMLVAENRRLRDVLLERGYDVTYTEFDGGHDYACWRGGLAVGLVELLSTGG
ncbi:enterochelin esterase [Streptomyces sp. SID3343]|uniref:enterochelin esterase n=1 Tax=Streptomyces sp. SID3343 TaxID=2690260 RepID=UPI0013686CFD|nr:enterochelin esterase [Streptomyces sp. SID3343]MYW03126.1 enterochelin esterase [Streptomyces sp. SID3343]